MKWIRCEVNPSQTAAFAAGQQAWQALGRLKGFIAQMGGWNEHIPLEACILSIWENHLYYKRFMEHVHDEMFGNSSQKGTYRSIDVRLFECDESFPFTKLGSMLEQGDGLMFLSTETDAQTKIMTTRNHLTMTGQSIDFPIQPLSVSLVQGSRQVFILMVQK